MLAELFLKTFSRYIQRMIFWWSAGKNGQDPKKAMNVR